MQDTEALTKFTKGQLDLIRGKVAHWPTDTSVKRASEELIELALALLHYDRDKASVQEVLYEMADVRIAIQHLEFKFGNYQSHLDEKVSKGNA